MPNGPEVEKSPSYVPESPELRRLIEATFEEAKSIQARYPHQLLLALADPRVQMMLDARFQSGQVLTDVAPLPAQRETGLIPMYLTFAPGASLQLPTKSILVQLDHRCRVVHIGEEFVPERPNPLVETRPAEAGPKGGPDVSRRGKAPFALAASGGRRFVRAGNPVLLKEIRRREIDLVVQHGLLSHVEFESLGGDTGLRLDTECTLPETVLTDTVSTVIVLDENGGVVDMFTETELDPSVEYRTMVDDSETTTINGLLDRLGLPGI